MPTTIAVIGGGPAGVAMCLKLFERIRETIVNEGRCAIEEAAVKIVVFEKSSVIGPGLPYSSLYKSHVLNFPKEIMKAVFDSKVLPEAQDVMDKRENLSNSFLDTEYPPRYLFGEFLNARAEQIRKEAGKIGIALEYHTNTEVINVEILDDENFEIETLTAKFPANFVVLCTGIMESKNYCDLIGKKGYWHNRPFSSAKDLESFDSNKDVAIIGCQQTALDLVLLLCKECNLQGKLVIASRSGLLPVVHPKKFVDYELKYLPDYIESTKGELSLTAILSLVWKEISEAQGNHIDFDSISKSYKDINPLEWLDRQIKEAAESQKPWLQLILSVFWLIPTFWYRLKLTDQTIFMTEYCSVFMAYLGGIPQEEAIRIRKLIHDGRLRVLGGLKSISCDNDDQFTLQFENGTALTTSQLFNASGTGCDIRSLVLYRKMCEQGSITAHPIAGVTVSPHSLCVLDREGKENDRMFAIGELTKGVVFSTSDIRRIALQADIIASIITQKMTVVSF